MKYYPVIPALLALALLCGGCEESEESTSTATDDNSTTGNDQSISVDVDGSNNVLYLDLDYQIVDPGSTEYEQGEVVSAVEAAMVMEVGGKTVAVE